MDPEWHIRARDKVATKCDQDFFVLEVPVQGRFCRIKLEATSENDRRRIAPCFDEWVDPVIISTVIISTNSSLDKMLIGKMQALQLTNNVSKSRYGILHPHSLISLPWGKPDPNPVGPNSVNDDTSNLEDET